MNIRKIQIQELLPALHLAAEVFAEDVAPAYTDEGVGRFHEFISYDSFREMFERQEVTIFGAFEGVQICGMIAVTNNGHISLFFVRKAFQRHGIGRMLYLAAVAFVFTIFPSRISVPTEINSTVTLHSSLRKNLNIFRNIIN